MQGKIRFISPPPKTFGFIAPKGSTQREENVYFHAAMLVGTQFRDLFVGQHVTFELDVQRENTARQVTAV